jgi:hypothetical protein
LLQKREGQSGLPFSFLVVLSLFRLKFPDVWLALGGLGPVTTEHTCPSEQVFAHLRVCHSGD